MNFIWRFCTIIIYAWLGKNAIIITNFFDDFFIEQKTNDSEKRS